MNMLEGQPDEIANLLKRITQGDAAAENLLFEAILAHLKGPARLFFAPERQEHASQSAERVNESFLPLPHGALTWQDCQHLYVLAARAARRILVDQARDRTESSRYNTENSAKLLAIDRALLRLAEIDPHRAQIFEMHFFGRLTEEEIAEMLAIPVRTVKREWHLACMWLYRQLGDEGDAGAVPVLTS